LYLCFGKHDGSKDAMIAASLPRPQVYTGLSIGVVVYRTVPGINGCSLPSTILSQDQPFKKLPEVYSGPMRSMRIQTLCGAAASRYAAAFNETLAMVKPQTFHAACPTRQPEAK
jgi:hypothetical protein